MCHTDITWGGGLSPSFLPSSPAKESSLKEVGSPTSTPRVTRAPVHDRRVGKVKNELCLRKGVSSTDSPGFEKGLNFQLIPESEVSTQWEEGSTPGPEVPSSFVVSWPVPCRSAMPQLSVQISELTCRTWLDLMSS